MILKYTFSEFLEERKILVALARSKKSWASPNGSMDFHEICTECVVL